MSLIESLVNLGISETEAKVYLHLVKNKSCTATEIAKSTGISRTQTYQIISNLIKNNMCIEQLGSVKKYYAVDPEKVTWKLNKDLEEKKKTLDEIAPKLSELFNEEMQNENPFDFIRVLYTTSTIIQTIQQLEESSQESVFAFNKPPYAMNIDVTDVNEILMELRDSEKDSLEKGVKIKSLYEIDDTKDFIKKVEYFQNHGEDVKIAKKLPFKLFIFDYKKVILALQNKMTPDLKFVTLLIEHKEFATALTEIFEIYWNSSITIDEYKKQIIKGE